MRVAMVVVAVVLGLWILAWLAVFVLGISVLSSV